MYDQIIDQKSKSHLYHYLISSLLTSYTSFNLTSLIIFTHFTYANKRATGIKIHGQMDIYKVYKEEMQMRS